MTNKEAANVLRIMASGIELKGYTDIWISSFKRAYEMAIKALEEYPTDKEIQDDMRRTYLGGKEE